MGSHKKMREGYRERMYLEFMVDAIEAFRRASDMTRDEFLKYMNEHDLWSDIGDDSYISGVVGKSADDVLRYMGRYLSNGQCDALISRYNENEKKSLTESELMEICFSFNDTEKSCRKMCDGCSPRGCEKLRGSVVSTDKISELRGLDYDLAVLTYCSLFHSEV